MSLLPLIGAAYQDKSPVVSAQETINLYAEINSNLQAPAPITYYYTPGSYVFSTPETLDNARCTYRTSIGTAYVVIGVNVFFLTEDGLLIFVGVIPDRISQIYMADNGLAVVLVDGVQGWAIDMATNNFNEIIDAAFYGADFVCFLDTFFIFNRPDTNQWYISLSMVTYAMLIGGSAFDALDIAAKSGSADPIVGIATTHKELWLIGELTTEIWIGTGAADFYFQLVQGAYIDHGCAAPYSVATQDVAVFWLMKDKQGIFQIMKGAGYEVNNICTSYLVEQFQSYDTVEDAIGYCFQQSNHAFYALVFPTANITWLYDLTSKHWTRWSWLDSNGNINRHRSNGCMFFADKNMYGDWETGRICVLDPTIFTDFDEPIFRRKTYAHMIGDNFERITYNQFTAYMQVGTQDVSDPDDLPKIYLFWSDNGGISYGNAVEQTFGQGGNFLTTINWTRLGSARDRIFKLEWSANIKTSLVGAFIKSRPQRT